METQFFKEGDELSTPPPVESNWDETTVICARRRRKRGLATWLAVAAAALVVCAVLAFWRTRGNAEPARPALPQVAPVEPAHSAPALPPADRPGGESASAFAAPTGEPAPLPTTIEAATQSETNALDACKQAFANHRGKDVLGSCGRAFAESLSSAEVAVMLAKTEFDRGRTRQASLWARKALALDEGQADAYVFLGSAEQASGHAAAGKAAFQRYLQLSPKGRYAADLRAILGSP